MARPWPLIVAGIILSFGAALVLQTLCQAQPPAKASDEPKDTAKRIVELEKKLADQKAENEKALLLLQREITILRAEKKERESFESERGPRPPVVVVKEVRPMTTRQKALAAIELLQRPIYTKGLEEKVKLAIAVEYLMEQLESKLPIVLDKDAFLAEFPPDAPDLYEEEVSLPSIPAKIPVETALRQLLTQVGRGRATYMIRQGQVEITTRKFASAAYAMHRARVTVDFDQRPLKLALQDLADESGIDIHVDPNVGKSADALITATFRNASVENAIVTITDMAKLKYVILERSIYVTDTANAKSMQKDEQDRGKVRDVFEKELSKYRRLEAAH